MPSILQTVVKERNTESLRMIVSNIFTMQKMAAQFGIPRSLVPPLVFKDINDEDLVFTVQTLEGLPIQNLQIVHSELGVEGMEALNLALRQFPIETLTLGDCDIDEESMPLLAEALKGTSVKDLSLEFNGLGKKEMRVLAQALPETQVSRLNLAHCGLDDWAVKAFAKTLPSTNVIELSLEENNITSLGIYHLARSLEKMKTLNLDHNFLQDHGVTILADALPSCALISLSLQDNQITNAGAEHLGQYLDGGLEFLDLCSNPLGDHGVVAMMRDSSTESTLKELHLEDCGITDKAMAMLAVLLPKGLSSLNLACNDISNDGLAALAPGLAKYEHLSVCLHETSLTSGVREILAASDLLRCGIDIEVDEEIDLIRYGSPPGLCPAFAHVQEKGATSSSDEEFETASYDSRSEEETSNSRRPEKA